MEAGSTLRLALPTQGTWDVLSEHSGTHTPQEIQLLQKPRLLALQTLRHAVHFPEEEANMALLSFHSGDVSYHGVRGCADIGCPGPSHWNPARSTPHWGQGGLKDHPSPGEHLLYAGGFSHDLT